MLVSLSLGIEHVHNIRLSPHEPHTIVNKFSEIYTPIHMSHMFDIFMTKLVGHHVRVCGRSYDIRCSAGGLIFLTLL